MEETSLKVLDAIKRLLLLDAIAQHELELAPLSDLFEEE